MSRVLSLHHVSVLVSDTARALAFYRDVLGLPVDDSRPAMNFAGAWLWIGAQQLHLIELAAEYPAGGSGGHGGRDRHIALQVTGLEVFAGRLEASGIEVSPSRSGRRALFCRDPDGNAVELIEVSAEHPDATPGRDGRC
jgi:glyoxylase I family protein